MEEVPDPDPEGAPGDTSECSSIAMTTNNVYGSGDGDVASLLQSLNLTSTGHSPVLSTFQQAVLHNYDDSQILNWENKGLTDELNPEFQQILQHVRPKAVNLDFNMISILPDDFSKQPIEILSVRSQIQPSKASLDRKPMLQMLPESFGQLTYLKELNVSHNNLSYLPPSFGDLASLKVVDFSLNFFRMFPSQLISLPLIQEINLSGNYISELPREIGKMTQLQSLRIANNELHSLPQELSKLSNLSTLSVRNNKIVQLPRKLYDCQHLIGGELLVSDNPLIYPPKEVWQVGTRAIFEYLKQHEPERKTGEENMMILFGDCLDLSKKHLTQLDIPRDTYGPNIQTLDARENAISSLPNFRDDLCQIKTILLDDNGLVSFPLVELKQLQGLNILSISRQLNESGATLDKLPDNIYHLKQLTELYLCHNKITMFPEGVLLLPHLKVLDMLGNNLTSIPENISKMGQLEFLGLGKNLLEELPTTIGDLHMLKVLSLSMNKLLQLPDSICDLAMLQTLSLRGNCLQRLPLHFNKLTQLLCDKEYKIFTTTFPSGCILDNNPDMTFPSQDVVKQGTQAVFDDLMFWQENPHLLDEQYRILSESHIRGRHNVHTLTDKYLKELSRGIGEHWLAMGSSLGVPYPDLEQWKADPEPAFKMLVSWRNKSKYREEAMLSKLAKALEYVNLHRLAAEVRLFTSPD